MSEHFELELISSFDAIRALPKAATSGLWTKGDILTMDGTGKVDPRTAAGSGATDIETAMIGIGLTTEALDANAETNNVHVPVSIFLPEQIWSIHVADGQFATDYLIGAGYELGYIGTAVDYDIAYVSGGTARTISVAESYYLTTTAAGTAGQGAIVVAHPDRGVGRDAQYGGRVHVRFGPLACMQITG